MSIVHGLQISSATGAAALTPEQKRFNNLIRQIEQARRTLAAWQDNIPLYLQAYLQQIEPLITTLDAARREWALALDHLLDQPGWTKTERDTLRDLICDSAAEILGAGGEDDAAMKALFDKHSEVDFDTEQQHARRALKDLMESVTGLDLGDDTEIPSDEDLFSRMQDKLRPEAAGADAQAPEAPSRRRRKTAAQERRESEAQLATQSLREIFRKLASALHPDRETDPEQRVAKTALMQKVNQAYAANDLLTLLELQLQIEQVDVGHIANASAQRLKHYNKVLSEQLNELKTEILRVEDGFRFEFGMERGWGMNPTKLLGTVDRNAKHLRADLAMHQRDMRMLGDRAATKRWLKRERQMRRDAEFDDEFF